jgi:hypothetical protein
VIEGVGGIVSKIANPRKRGVVSKSAGDEFKVVLKVEIFGLFVNHLLITPHTSYCHLQPNHHVENQIPIVIPNEDHVSLDWPLLDLDVYHCLLFLLGCLVVQFLI